jgi:hypothetical protein
MRSLRFTAVVAWTALAACTTPAPTPIDGDFSFSLVTHNGFTGGLEDRIDVISPQRKISRIDYFAPAPTPEEATLTDAELESVTQAIADADFLNRSGSYDTDWVDASMYDGTLTRGDNVHAVKWLDGSNDALEELSRHVRTLAWEKLRPPAE